jgi:hypothetical protein
LAEFNADPGGNTPCRPRVDRQPGRSGSVVMGPSSRSSDRVHSLTLVFAASLFAAAALVDAGPLIFEERTKVTVPGPTDQLTIGVGLSGNFMIVATRRNFDDPPGTTVSEQFAYLFQRSSATGQWSYLSTLIQRRDPHATAPPFAVAMEGSVAVVKAADLHVFELRPAFGSDRQFTALTSTASELDQGRLCAGDLQDLGGVR